MSDKESIKAFIRKVGDNPAMLDSFLNAEPGERRKLLKGHQGGREFKRAEVAQVVKELLASKPTAGSGSEERVVEWVGAIAAGVAGAMAA